MKTLKIPMWFVLQVVVFILYKSVYTWNNTEEVFTALPNSELINFVSFFVQIFQVTMVVYAAAHKLLTATVIFLVQLKVLLRGSVELLTMRQEALSSQLSQRLTWPWQLYSHRHVHITHCPDVPDSHIKCLCLHTPISVASPAKTLPAKLSVAAACYSQTASHSFVTHNFVFSFPCEWSVLKTPG